MRERERERERERDFILLILNDRFPVLLEMLANDIFVRGKQIFLSDIGCLSWLKNLQYLIFMSFEVHKNHFLAVISTRTLYRLYNALIVAMENYSSLQA